MRQAMQGETVFSGDPSARHDGVHELRQAGRLGEVLRELRHPRPARPSAAGCGNDLAAGTRFCGNCGRPVDAPG